MALNIVEFHVRGEWVSSDTPIRERRCGKDRRKSDRRTGKDRRNTNDAKETLPIQSDDVAEININ